MFEILTKNTYFFPSFGQNTCTVFDTLFLNGEASIFYHSCQMVFIIDEKVFFFLHISSFGQISRSLRLEGFLTITLVFSSLHRISTGFRSGLQNIDIVLCQPFLDVFCMFWIAILFGRSRVQVFLQPV